MPSNAAFTKPCSLNRIDLGCHPATWRVERLMSGLLEIPIDGELAVESVLLMNSAFHRDPADELIVATAMRTGMELALDRRQTITIAIEI